MQRIIIVSLCFIATLHAMEQPNDIFIDFAQEKHIPALTALSNEVTDNFFKPVMFAEYAEYNQESLEGFFNKADTFFAEFFKKATSNGDDNDMRVLIASDNKESDKILGLCAFVKDKDCLFIQYLIVSQQLQGKGIGKALLDRAISGYKDIVVCRLVTLARGNEATQAFYEKLGFTSTKELCAAIESMPNTHFMYQLNIKK